MAHQLIQTSLRAGLLFLLGLLSACQTPPQTLQLLATPPDIARQHIMSQVPFYPQQQYFCGPTTLAEVAGFYGFSKSPDDIAPNTFIPGRQGTLQIEMAAATRQLGMLAYVQPRATMAQLLSLVAENMPLIVLQNNSIAWLPQWHYAVVIGYDLDSAEVILHTGVTAQHRLNFATFERTWQRGDYWLLAMLPPDKASAQLDPFLYTKACQDLLNTGLIAAGVLALETATQQWPDYWLPYFLLANHYFTAAPLVAAAWFEQGLAAAQQQAGYLNNYALLLSGLGCHQKAIALINTAVELSPRDSNLLDSQQQVFQAQQASADALSQCQIMPVGQNPAGMP